MKARALLTAAILVLAMGKAAAQSLPGTVTIHVGFPAGGPADAIARIVADELGKKTGQVMVVLNRAGAGGTTAAGVLARMEPDGGNLLLVSSGHAGAPALYPSLKFDNQKDFTPIIGLAQSPIVVLVGKTSPYKSMQDLVSAALAAPGKLNFGTGGGATLTSLAALLLRRELGYDAVPVHFQGTGPANIALMGGSVDFSFDTISGAAGLVSGGEVRALAVTGKARASIVPDVPTINETVKPGFEVTGWFGLLGPAGMRKEAVDKLNRDLNDILDGQAMKSRLAKLGFEPIGGTSEAFAVLIASETQRWGAVIREFKLGGQN